MDFNHEQEIEINQETLKILKYRIYNMERENYKTKKFKDSEMVDRIRKLIEMEVEKNGY